MFSWVFQLWSLGRREVSGRLPRLSTLVLVLSVLIGMCVLFVVDYVVSAPSPPSIPPETFKSRFVRDTVCADDFPGFNAPGGCIPLAIVHEGLNFSKAEDSKLAVKPVERLLALTGLVTYSVWPNLGHTDIQVFPSWAEFVPVVSNRTYSYVAAVSFDPGLIDPSRRVRNSSAYKFGPWPSHIPNGDIPWNHLVGGGALPSLGPHSRMADAAEYNDTYSNWNASRHRRVGPRRTGEAPVGPRSFVRPHNALFVSSSGIGRGRRDSLTMFGEKAPRAQAVDSLLNYAPSYSLILNNSIVDGTDTPGLPFYTQDPAVRRNLMHSSVVALHAALDFVLLANDNADFDKVKGLDVELFRLPSVETEYDLDALITSTPTLTPSVTPVPTSTHSRTPLPTRIPAPNPLADQECTVVPRTLPRWKPDGPGMMRWFVPCVVAFCCLAHAVVLLMDVSRDRHSGMKTKLRTMGLSDSLQAFSLFVTSALIAAVCSGAAFVLCVVAWNISKIATGEPVGAGARAVWSSVNFAMGGLYAPAAFFLGVMASCAFAYAAANGFFRTGVAAGVFVGYNGIILVATMLGAAATITVGIEVPVWMAVTPSTRVAVQQSVRGILTVATQTSAVFKVLQTFMWFSPVYHVAVAFAAINDHAFMSVFTCEELAKVQPTTNVAPKMSYFDPFSTDPNINLAYSPYWSKSLGEQPPLSSTIPPDAAAYVAAVKNLVILFFMYVAIGLYTAALFAPNGSGRVLPPWFLGLPSWWAPDFMRRRRAADRAALREKARVRSVAAAAGGAGETEELEDAFLTGAVDVTDAYEIAMEASNDRSLTSLKLTKMYDTKRAFSEVSLRLRAGRIHAVLGHNGAGKTTTVNVLCGRTPPTFGSVFFDGEDVTDALSVVMRSSLGVCEQENVVFEDLSAWQHLMFFGMFRGAHPASIVRARAEDYLRRLGLWEWRFDNVGTFSGGMKRRLCIALAVIDDPSVVFLDEPTTGLDPLARRIVWEFIRSLRAERKVVLLTTHAMDEAEALGDDIIIFADGRLKATGSPSELRQRYGTGTTVSFQLAGKSGGALLSSVEVAASAAGSADVTSAGAPSQEDFDAFVDTLRKVTEDAVPAAQLLETANGTVNIRILPRDKNRIPALLRSIDQFIITRSSGSGVHAHGGSKVGVAEWLVACATLEDIFLRITAQRGLRGGQGGGATTQVDPFLSADIHDGEVMCGVCGRRRAERALVFTGYGIGVEASDLVCGQCATEIPRRVDLVHDDFPFVAEAKALVVRMEVEQAPAASGAPDPAAAGETVVAGPPEGKGVGDEMTHPLDADEVGLTKAVDHSYTPTAGSPGDAMGPRGGGAVPPSSATVARTNPLDGSLASLVQKQAVGVAYLHVMRLKRRKGMLACTLCCQVVALLLIFLAASLVSFLPLAAILGVGSDRPPCFWKDSTWDSSDCTWDNYLTATQLPWSQNGQNRFFDRLNMGYYNGYENSLPLSPFFLNTPILQSYWGPEAEVTYGSVMSDPSTNYRWQYMAVNGMRPIVVPGMPSEYPALNITHGGADKITRAEAVADALRIQNANKMRAGGGGVGPSLRLSPALMYDDTLAASRAAEEAKLPTAYLVRDGACGSQKLETGTCSLSVGSWLRNDVHARQYLSEREAVPFGSARKVGFSVREYVYAAYPTLSGAGILMSNVVPVVAPWDAVGSALLSIRAAYAPNATTSLSAFPPASAASDAIKDWSNPYMPPTFTVLITTLVACISLTLAICVIIPIFTALLAQDREGGRLRVLQSNGLLMPVYMFISSAMPAVAGLLVALVQFALLALTVGIPSDFRGSLLMTMAGVSAFVGAMVCMFSIILRGRAASVGVFTGICLAVPIVCLIGVQGHRTSLVADPFGWVDAFVPVLGYVSVSYMIFSQAFVPRHAVGPAFHTLVGGLVWLFVATWGLLLWEWAGEGISTVAGRMYARLFFGRRGHSRSSHVPDVAVSSGVTEGSERSSGVCMAAVPSPHGVVDGGGGLATAEVEDPEVAAARREGARWVRAAVEGGGVADAAPDLVVSNVWKVFARSAGPGADSSLTDVAVAVTQGNSPPAPLALDSAQSILSVGATGGAARTARGRGGIFRVCSPDVFAAVQGVSLTAQKGEVLGVLGPNGAGKSTLLNSIAGELSPAVGGLLIGGHLVAHRGGEHAIGGAPHSSPSKRGWFNVRSWMRDLGVCPQYSVVYPELTVNEHLILMRWLRGFGSDRLTKAVRKAAALVALDGDDFHCKASTLSGGTARRLALAMSVVGEPAVVLLDEPTTGLDVDSKLAVWGCVRAVSNSTAVVLSTHSMGEADALCDRISIIAGGTLRCIGTTVSLKGKFGSGVTVCVTVGDDVDGEVADRAVTRALSMYDVQLRSVAGPTRTYGVSSATDNVLPGVLYSALQAKDVVEIAQDVSVAHESLDDVFLRVVTDAAADVA